MKRQKKQARKHAADMVKSLQRQKDDERSQILALREVLAEKKRRLDEEQHLAKVEQSSVPHTSEEEADGVGKPCDIHPNETKRNEGNPRPKEEREDDDETGDDHEKSAADRKTFVRKIVHQLLVGNTQDNVRQNLEIDSEAQYYYGLMNLLGSYLYLDYPRVATGTEFIVKSAKQHNARAQLTLGTLHEFGDSGLAENSATAAEWYQASANGGDAMASFNLGCLYRVGKGVEQDNVRAAECFNTAARSGLKEAAFQLGVMHARGEGVVPQNDISAVKWFRKAAGQGLTKAQYNLGVMCEHGQGLTRSDPQAIEWYKKAALQGHAKAQYSLGVMYSAGRGAPQDFKEACRWLSMASPRHQEAHTLLLACSAMLLPGDMQQTSGCVPTIEAPLADNNKKDTAAAASKKSKGRYTVCMDPVQRKMLQCAAAQGCCKAQMMIGAILETEGKYSEAQIWLVKSAKQGHPEAQFAVANMYLGGKGVEKNKLKAIGWCRKAADQGLASAQNTLGSICADQGNQNEEAMEWFTKAANQGDQEAQENLGVMSLREGDDAKAIQWFRKAAKQGSIDAVHSLGVQYSKIGENGKALEMFQRAADKGHSHSQCSLGAMYEHGCSVPASYKKALAWFKKAANTGDSLGQYSLGMMFLQGKGVQKSAVVAQNLFRKSAEQNLAIAQLFLGFMHMIGHGGVERNKSLSLSWLQKAADNGRDEALTWIELMKMTPDLSPHDIGVVEELLKHS